MFSHFVKVDFWIKKKKKDIFLEKRVNFKIPAVFNKKLHQWEKEKTVL